MAPELDPTWESWFDGLDFARGLGYYEEGLVKLRDADADGWHAYVDGSQRYSVYLACDDDGYASPNADMTTCTCPRFHDGYLCKHIAAVCRAVEASGSAFSERKDRAVAETSGLIDSVSAEECKAFLRGVLAADSKWAREFANRFGELDANRAFRDLEADLDDIVDEHSPYGYVGWNESISCEFDICEAISRAIDPFMEAERYGDVMDLSFHALSLIRGIEVDDSNGFYDSTAATCMSYWGKVADSGPEGELLVAQRVVRFCLEEEEQGDSEREEILTYQVDDAEEFAVERFADDAAAADLMIALAKERMGAPAEQGSDFPEYRERRRAYWMVVCLRAMKASGASLDELVEFAGQLLGRYDVAELLAGYAEEAGDYRRAVELLESARAAAGEAGRPADAGRISELLLPLYEGLCDVGAQESCLRDLVAYAGEGAVGAYYLKLKGLMGERRWREERGRLLDSARSAMCRCVCLEAEGATAELWEAVQGAGMHELTRFEAALAGDYAEQIAELYRTALMDDLARARSRDGYRRALQTLGRIRRLPGGEERAAEAAREIESLYPKRSALLDELGKVRPAE